MESALCKLIDRNYIIMFGSSYKVATILGIPIKVHISLLLMVLIMMHEFGPISGIFIELGLVISIVLHELGHSIVAIHKGCRVREITLMLIGGAAKMERIPEKPLDEFLMALAGPAVSFVLGLAGWFLGVKMTFLPSVKDFGVNVVQILGIINIGLLLFNLLPSFPMDGGRVLRAVLSPKLGRVKATFIAARVGRIIAVLFGIKGLLSGNFVLLFIAFFIYTAAGQEYKYVQMEAMYKQRMPGYNDGLESFADAEVSDGQVVVSPPPYDEKGRATKSDIHSDN